MIPEIPFLMQTKEDAFFVIFHPLRQEQWWRKWCGHRKGRLGWPTRVGCCSRPRAGWGTWPRNWGSSLCGLCGCWICALCRGSRQTRPGGRQWNRGPCWHLFLWWTLSFSSCFSPPCFVRAKLKLKSEINAKTKLIYGEYEIKLKWPIINNPWYSPFNPTTKSSFLFLSILVYGLKKRFFLRQKICPPSLKQTKRGHICERDYFIV